MRRIAASALVLLSIFLCLGLPAPAEQNGSFPSTTLSVPAPLLTATPGIFDPPATCPPDSTYNEETCECEPETGESKPKGCFNESSGADLYASHVASDGSSASTRSASGVRFANGQLDILTDDFQSMGQAGWGHSRTYASAGETYEGLNTCTGWVSKQVPILLTDDPGSCGTGFSQSTYSAILYKGAHPTRSYVKSGNSYTPDYWYKETLTYDSMNDELVLKTTTGERWVFHNFDSTSPTRRALFKTYYDADGNQTTVTRDGSNRVSTVVRSFGGVDEKWTYTYVASGVAVNNWADVTLAYDSGSGYVTARKAVYEYYTNASFNGDGNPGSVKRVRIQDGSSNVLETKYYRYYEKVNNFEGLHMQVEGRNYDRLREAAGGTDNDVDSASDATVDDYADRVMTYDQWNQVATLLVQSAGCNCGSNGSKGKYVYSYTANPNYGGNATNNWKTETIEQFLDFQDTELYRNTVYTNYLGQVMLKVFKDASSGKEWRTYFQYDSAGRLILEATPSAVTGHDTDEDGLITSSDLKTSDGLIYTYDYWTGTDSPQAGTSTVGAVPGYFKSSMLKKGNSDANPDTQELVEYIKRAGNVDTFPVAKRTVYRDADGGSSIATSFAYTWSGSSNVMESRTTTFPTVTTAQNGPNSADTTVEYFDEFGRRTWLKDEDGFIHHTQYDPATGAVTRDIVDVDTDLTGDFNNLPSGWSNPNGIHLKTDYVVDNRGRATKITDPKGNVTYVVYKDADHEVRTYPGWDTGTDKPTGPTIVQREVWDLAFDDFLATDATPSLNGSDEPTGTESIGSNVKRWTRTLLDLGNRPDKRRDYFSPSGLTYSATSTNIGTLNTNYYETVFGYDHYGLEDRVQDGSGTILRAIRDARRRVVSQWIGTDDTPDSGTWPSTTTGTNMLKIEERQYDHVASPVAGVGNDTLTQVKVFGTDSTFYTTEKRYDWRDRLEVGRSPDNVTFKRTFDNLSQETARETFVDADTDLVLDSGELRAKTEAAFDEEGKVYQTSAYEVVQSTGATADKLVTNFWYNRRGLQIKEKTANSLLHKIAYDGARRQVATYTTVDDAETSYADADDVGSDKVLEQTKTIYDKAWNVVTFTRFERSDSDTTDTGELEWVDNSLPEVFVDVWVYWYDKANRETHRANYGRDDGGTRYVYNTNGTLIDSNSNGIPNEAENTAREPDSSSDYRVTKTQFDAAGFPYRSTDNLDRITETTFDAEGRVLKVVENYDNGSVSATEFDVDRTTEYLRIAGGRVEKMRAHNAKGSSVEQQDTLYLYESAINKSWPTNIIYPDSSDSTSSGSDQVKLGYDRLGRMTQRTDQRGTIRDFTYDSAGRLSSDAVSTVGSDTDSTVRRIERSYDTLSRLEKVTSYDAASSGSVVNEVKLTYNDWRHLSKIEQANTGAVTTGTPAVDLAYADGASSGLAKFVRLSSVTYPGPSTRRIVYVTYGSSGSFADRLSRVDNKSPNSDGSSRFVDFSYLGAGYHVIRESRGGVTGSLALDLRSGGNYDGFNRFGEVIDQQWTGSSTDYDRYLYEYDRVGNRINRDVVPTTAPSTSMDEYYVVDGLNRLEKMNRGSLSSGSISDANANYSQIWDELESVGNWKTWKVDANGGTTGGLTTHTRTHNKVNEITAASGASPDWIDPTYDAAGNMKSGPKGGDESTRLHFIHDAWNRLAEVKNDSSGSPGTTLVSYRYNGLNHRVRKIISGGDTWDYYYNDQWQCLETRLNSDPDPKDHYIWSVRYIDALALWFRDAHDDGDFGDTDEKLYVLQDANHNVTALMNAGGSVVERNSYLPYGQPLFWSGTWSTRTSSSYDNEVLLAGYRYAINTGTYHARHREYHPSAGAWVSRDWLDYYDTSAGGNLYQYVSSAPTLLSDPTGLLTSGGYDKDRCNRLVERLTAIKARITRRICDLARNKKLRNLPEHHPDEDTKPSLSKSGHRRLIAEDQKLSKQLEEEFDKNCRDPKTRQPRFKYEPVPRPKTTPKGTPVKKFVGDVLDDLGEVIEEGLRVWGRPFRNPPLPGPTPVPFPVPIPLPLPFPVPGR